MIHRSQIYLQVECGACGAIIGSRCQHFTLHNVYVAWHAVRRRTAIADYRKVLSQLAACVEIRRVSESEIPVMVREPSVMLQLLADYGYVKKVTIDIVGLLSTGWMFTKRGLKVYHEEMQHAE